MHSNTAIGTIIGLDIGDVRIGVARANSIAKIPEALGILTNDDSFMQQVALVVQEHAAELLVVGLPLHASGDITKQAQKIKQQAEEIQKSLQVKVVYVDESLSSRQADTLISNDMHNDSVAACVILSRYFEDGELKHV